MEPTPSFLHLAARQILGNATAASPTDVSAKPTCGGGGLDPTLGFDMSLHIGALFIILVTSAFGMSLGDPY